MQTFKKILGSMTGIVSIILVIAILAMANYISTRNFKRFDLTEDQQYSVSEATKTTLGSLNDLVTVKVYFSKKLPPEFLEVSQYVKDILEEYTAFSDGNLNVLYLDPADNDDIRNEAVSLGIPELQMNFLEDDKFQVQNGFLGIGIFYEDKQEVLPVVQNIKTLEYDLTSAIKKVSAERIKVVGFLTGHGEHLTYQASTGDGKGDYTLIRKELEKNYDIETVLIENGKKIEGIDTLVVAGPEESFSQRDLFEIDQFIMSGGNAIFLIDGVKITPEMQAVANQTGVESLIANYGIKVNNDLVMDESNENVAFTSGYMRFFVPYPFWPKLIQENFAKDNIVLNKIEKLVLPWASSLEILDKSNLETEVLATTSKYGGRITENFDLNPNQKFTPEGVREKIDMVTLVKGKFDSYFAGRSIPAVPTKTSASSEIALANPEENVGDTDRQIIEARKDEGYILVVGDSDFLADNQLQSFANNAVFFLNAVDYLTLDSDLMSIRSRGLQDRTFKELSEKEKNIIKFIGIALVPILVGLFAILKAVLRRKLKNLS